VVDGRDLPAQEFSALTALTGFVHCFTTRVPGIDVGHDKAKALRRLDGVHQEVRAAFRLADRSFITAEQVHGAGIAVIERLPETDHCFSGCDGLITNQSNLCLGIYVADCCAVYVVDPVRDVIGLVHSGKKGTELGIVGRAIDEMCSRFGSFPQDLIVQLSPCIRPPHYEIDFAAQIVRTCTNRGVISVNDSGICTACDLERYYSYRAEKGKTGRMLALLALERDALSSRRSSR